MEEIDQLRKLRDEITRGHPARDAVAIVRRDAGGERPRLELLDRFLQGAMRLDPAVLREVLTDGAESIGVEATIRDVALPAMREMGSRWKAGVCDTAHEHLSTEAVRVWLARQSVMAPPSFRPFPLVLACGPKDLHTIGLEAFGVDPRAPRLVDPDARAAHARVLPGGRGARRRGARRRGHEPAQRDATRGPRGDRSRRRPPRAWRRSTRARGSVPPRPARMCPARTWATT